MHVGLINLKRSTKHENIAWPVPSLQFHSLNPRLTQTDELEAVDLVERAVDQEIHSPAPPKTNQDRTGTTGKPAYAVCLRHTAK
jgi:hypothetical protein